VLDCVNTRPGRRSQKRVADFYADLWRSAIHSGRHFSAADITDIITVDFATKGLKRGIPPRNVATLGWHKSISAWPHQSATRMAERAREFVRQPESSRSSQTLISFCRSQGLGRNWPPATLRTSIIGFPETYTTGSLGFEARNVSAKSHPLICPLNRTSVISASIRSPLRKSATAVSPDSASRTFHPAPPITSAIACRKSQSSSTIRKTGALSVTSSSRATAAVGENSCRRAGKSNCKSSTKLCSFAQFTQRVGRAAVPSSGRRATPARFHAFFKRAMVSIPHRNLSRFGAPRTPNSR